MTYPEGAREAEDAPAPEPAGAGALGGAFWGMLFGLIFFVPLLGMAIGAGMGALTGSMTDVGIDDAFIRRMRDEITAGHVGAVRALLGAVVDKVRTPSRASRWSWSRPT